MPIIRHITVWLAVAMLAVGAGVPTRCACQTAMTRHEASLHAAAPTPSCCSSQRRRSCCSAVARPNPDVPHPGTQACGTCDDSTCHCGLNCRCGADSDAPANTLPERAEPRVDDCGMAFVEPPAAPAPASWDARGESYGTFGHSFPSSSARCAALSRFLL